MILLIFVSFCLLMPYYYTTFYLFSYKLLLFNKA